jgi:DNA-binding PadR family transcriptional regulator
MNGWSPTDTIAMERRHITEGEKRVARQEALVFELTEKGHDQLVRSANKLLDLLRECLELSKERLWDLENRYGKAKEH